LHCPLEEFAEKGAPMKKELNEFLSFVVGYEVEAELRYVRE